MRLHILFFGIEAPDYLSKEETFGLCKTLGELKIMPVKNGVGGCYQQYKLIVFFVGI